MATKWIDFKELKRQVPIRQVLERYGLLADLSDKKGKLVGPCPIHGGTNSTSFHVDEGKGIWHCFSQCNGGNIIDLVMKIEDVDIRAAGERLMSWFDLSHERGAKPKQEQTKEPERQEDEVNPPLDHELKTLNQDHPYLVNRGLQIPTIKHFGIGFCNRGLMKGRIAIPIHREDGVLLAYAGRAVDDELAKEKGKYKLPEGFKKSFVLFNLNRAKEHIDCGLIVVEGFFGAMAVHQAGFPNVVALMGSTLSEQQEQFLLDHTDRLALMLDGDEAGTACKRDVWQRLIRKLYIRDIHLENGEQPDALSADRILELLS